MREKGLWKVPLLPKVANTPQFILSGSAITNQNSSSGCPHFVHAPVQTNRANPGEATNQSPLFLLYKDEEIKSLGKILIIDRDVLYGWCRKCRESHNAEYKKIEG